MVDVATTAPVEPDTGNTLKVWAFWCGALALAMVIAAVAAPEANEGFADGAAALAFIATVAVAIERSVEVFWTIVARSKLGGWWPLNQVRDSILAFEANTDALLAGPLESARQLLDDAKSAAQATGAGAQQIEDLIAELGPEIDRLNKKVANAKKLAPGSPRFELLTEAASDAVAHAETIATAAEAHVPDAARAVRERAEDLGDACDRATDIVTSFSDNPARTLLSLILGATIGVLVAGFMGLNLFLAALGDGEDFALGLSGTTGIILTGVILGFGANPTHEVINALQRRKGDSTSTTTPLGTEAADAVIPLAGPALGAGGAGARYLFQPTPTVSSAGLQSSSYRRARTLRRTD